MPVDPNAPRQVSAYTWVPDFAKGHVRDLRVRWACEEAGLPYAVRLLDVRQERPQDYMREQPFGQVPAFRDGDVRMFESGAILLHIGESSEALLPRDPQMRASAKSWVVAALNSIEPTIQQLAEIDSFYHGESWAKQRRPQVLELATKRLDQLAAYLGGEDWLEGEFTAGDLMMVCSLRSLSGNPVLDRHPVLASYVARGEARPAFQRALAAQFADFEED